MMKLFGKKYEPIEIYGTNQMIIDLNQKILSLNIENDIKLELQNLLFEIDKENEKSQIQDQRQQILEEKNGDYYFILSRLKKFRDNFTPYFKFESEIYKQNIDTIINENDFKSFHLTGQKEIINGDFIFYFKINDEKYIVVGDCSGHDNLTAMFKFAIWISLNEYFKQNHDNPNDIIKINDYINVFFERYFKINEKTTKIFELSICKLNDYQIEFFGTGTNLCIVTNENSLVHYKANLKNELIKEELKCIKSIYLFTDGIYNQCNNDNKKFGLDKLKTKLIEIANEKTNEKHNKIATEINNWIADKELLDDYLIVGIDIMKNENC